MGIFDDNPPAGLVRGKKGWLKPKKTGTQRHLAAIKKENADLKDRLAQLETVVSELATKKGKKNGQKEG